MLLVRVPERERDETREREIIMRRGFAGALRSVTTMSSRPSWQQTMLRIKDPKKSLDFYEKHLGMKLVDKYDFKAWEFSLYFLVSMKPGETLAFTPGTPEAREYLWNTEKVTLELTHNWGTEKVRSTPQVQTKEFLSNKLNNCLLLLLPSSSSFRRILKCITPETRKTTVSGTLHSLLMTCTKQGMPYLLELCLNFV